jgi:hypothetical protein
MQTYFLISRRDASREAADPVLRKHEVAATVPGHTLVGRIGQSLDEPNSCANRVG